VFKVSKELKDLVAAANPIQEEGEGGSPVPGEGGH